MAGSAPYAYKRPQQMQSPFAPALASAASLGGEVVPALHHRQERDLLGSASYHKDEVIYCPEGIPIKQALYALSAAATAALGFLYRAITMAGRRRRRRRSAAAAGEEEDPSSDTGYWLDNLPFAVPDVFHAGTKDPPPFCGLPQTPRF